MKVLFAAPENAWGGFLGMIKKELPGSLFDATGRFGFDSLKGYDVLIPTMTTVTRKMLEDGDQLKLIQQCGSGLEGVDLRAARDLGIQVANVPTDISGNADSVAEVGIYLMIGLARDVCGMAQSLAECKMGVPQGKALSGRVVGLIGLGGIGRALVHRLKPFGVRLIGIKRKNTTQAREELGMEWVGGTGQLNELLARSDFVILCLPVTAETKNLISTSEFETMKSSAYLINLSRGALVDRDALHKALSSAQIAGAGLDVFWQEPPDPADPVFSYNVLATPHIAGSTDHSMRGIVNVVAENIQRLADSRQILYTKHS